MTSVAVEAFHYAALAPLLFLIALRRDADARYWIVALAFSVSWFADLAVTVLDGSWALTYVYPALQFGMFGWAFGHVWLIVVLVTLAAIEISATPLEGPEVFVRVLGSLVLLYVSAGKELGWSMMAYCGLATGFYLLMTADVWADGYLPLWYGYQGSRLLAFSLFIAVAHRGAARA